MDDEMMDPYFQNWRETRFDGRKRNGWSIDDSWRDGFKAGYEAGYDAGYEARLNEQWG
ncbi:hypothetical protein ABZ470_31905 [Streptosporangium sp. NPDC020072]|uniref:hypothetical protein n=1 Tax=Streptosporangium sp. NPDC020072 TaxID=3154788 RepID=UPI003422CEA4